MLYFSGTACVELCHSAEGVDELPVLETCAMSIMARPHPLRDRIHLPPLQRETYSIGPFNLPTKKPRHARLLEVMNEEDLEPNTLMPRRPERAAQWTIAEFATLKNLVIPKNWATVEERFVYRSAFPEDESISFLQSEHIYTVLRLVDKPFSAKFAQWMNRRDGLLYICPIAPNKDGSHATVESVCDAIRFMLAPAHHRVYVHCNQGRHRTGCVVACLRKAQGWPIEPVLEEYYRFADPKPRLGDVEFIKAFNYECLIPYMMPIVRDTPFLRYHLEAPKLDILAVVADCFREDHEISLGSDSPRSANTFFGDDDEVIQTWKLANQALGGEAEARRERKASISPYQALIGRDVVRSWPLTHRGVQLRDIGFAQTDDGRQADNDEARPRIDSHQTANAMDTFGKNMDRVDDLSPAGGKRLGYKGKGKAKADDVTSDEERADYEGKGKAKADNNDVKVSGHIRGVTCGGRWSETGGGIIHGNDGIAGINSERRVTCRACDPTAPGGSMRGTKRTRDDVSEIGSRGDDSISISIGEVKTPDNDGISVVKARGNDGVSGPSGIGGALGTGGTGWNPGAIPGAGHRPPRQPSRRHLLSMTEDQSAPGDGPRNSKAQRRAGALPRRSFGRSQVTEDSEPCACYSLIARAIWDRVGGLFGLAQRRRARHRAMPAG